MNKDEMEVLKSEQKKLISDIVLMTTRLLHVTNLIGDGVPLETPKLDPKTPPRYWGPDPSFVPPPPSAESRQLEAHTVSWDKIDKI